MERLRSLLHRLDGKGYKAYKDMQGTYRFPGCTLAIDYVQGDPFATPSRVRVRVPQSRARLQTAWYETAHRRVALEDFIARQLAVVIQRHVPHVGGTGKSGLIAVDAPGQEILPRTAVRVADQFVEARLSVGLPASGRRILGRQAAQMLLEALPLLAEKALCTAAFDQAQLERRLKLVDNQQAIRAHMREKGWIAFVANGALLPRQSGVSDRPLKGENVVTFQAPPTLEAEIQVPHGAPLRGMALPAGVHLIVGGGYHGKSTLLKALERGVYDHIEGDGREYVLTDARAVKIRAEDGRRVEKVNISPFINNLPFGQTTERFSTEDASGSTSQAANIVEALESGCRALLIDEDTSATNFMIRDGRMQQLVAKAQEPITPFIDRVRQLLEEQGVSTVLVLGGSGDYFDVADTVIMMDNYLPYDVTAKAREIAQAAGTVRAVERDGAFGQLLRRAPERSSFDASRGKKEKVDAKGLHQIVYGRTTVDLTLVEQLVDASQTRAIAQMMRLIAAEADGRTALGHLIDQLYARIAQEGLAAISPYKDKEVHPGDLALPRKFELAAAVNRLRTLRMR
ncbi:ABC-ATPase domain-containing protein [Numidum massiliense]|uniref:ABC-ATPase domain-containing protein n=1 Tax=Numidum massiliense TaxID=1522315 RepID=UPI0006D53336|nr:ABC-ATPase domain-containing protein [Numidum massiliense]